MKETVKRITNDKNKFRLKIFILFITLLIFKAIFSDWEHFKAGLFGRF